ncbi:MAG: hypothetical protein KF758_04735 [Anaerolineales bacterium]|nr:hypothetical protein [Anaerolineales bacterium]
MPKPQDYPTYRELVAIYSSKRKFKEIHQMMRNKFYWDELAYTTALHYHKGDREPHPRYVLLLKYCLRLPLKQFRLIINAIHIDYTRNLFHTFRLEEENLIKNGAIDQAERISWDDLQPNHDK